MEQETAGGAAGRRGIAAVLADPHLRIALTYFTVAQLLDSLTTVTGLVLGLEELNPLTAGMLHSIGAFGLLVQKVPVLLAVVLAVAFLPRRIAILTTWTLTVVMAAVVANNAAGILAMHLH